MKEYHKGIVEATIKGDKLSKEELIADLDYIEELENENERLNNIIKADEKNYSNLVKEWKKQNNIIDELEKYINEEYTYDEVGMKIFDASTLQDKLKELKEEKNEQK